MWTALSKHHRTERASEWVFVFICLFVRVRACIFVCLCVYGCVKLVSGNTITNSINHLTPMFVIFTMNFLSYFLLASLPHWNVLSGANIWSEKKNERRLECFEYIFYLFFASRLWLHFNEVYRWTFACSLPASLPSSAIPLSPTINFCLSPYSCFLPFNLSPEKNVPSVHPVGWYRKGTKTV